MRRTLLALLTLGVFAAAFPASALPQEGKERARELSAEGQGLYDAGKYAEAAQRFEEAQRLFPHPINLFNAARAWEKAAEYERAAQAYKGYLDLHRELGTRPPDEEDVRRSIEVLRDKAYRALPEVTIESEPQGADIYIDDPDRVLGQTPFTTHLPEGTHTVYLKRPWHEPFQRQIEVRARQPLRLAFSLEKIRNEGGIRVVCNIRKARIYVDGKVVAVTPYNEVLRTEVGQHQVTVEKERYDQVSRTVQVEAGKVTEVQTSLALTSAGFSYRGGLGIASALLGAGALGTAFWLRSEAAGEFEDTSRFKTYRTWTYVGYGVGAGLLALGTGLLIWEFTRTAVDADDLVREDKPAIPQFLVGGDGRTWWVGATTRF